MRRSRTARRIRQAFVLGAIVGVVGAPRAPSAQAPVLGHVTFGSWWRPDLAFITTAGWEVVDRRGGGVGGTLSTLYYPEESRGTYTEPAATFSLGSLYAAYHWRPPHQRRQPFATIGFMFAEGIGLLDASGGVDWWTGRRTGFRIEVQDAFVPWNSVAVSVRGGLVFR